jgi:hypothetical protein
MADMAEKPKTGGAGFLALFFTAAPYTYQARAALVIGAQLRLENPYVYF